MLMRLQKFILFLIAGLILSSCKINTKIHGNFADNPSSGTASLKIETAADGTGNELTNQSLNVGQSLNIYAIERDSDGQFLANVEVSWVLNGGVGNLNILANGKEAEYQALSAGSAEIKATYQGVTKTLNLTITSGDATPDVFSFAAETNVTLSTLTVSDIIQITGIDAGADISISGDGSPEYRVCTDGSSSANCDGSEVQTWGSGAGAGVVQNNHYVQIRLTSSGSNSTTSQATLIIGGVNDVWNVTTVGSFTHGGWNDVIAMGPKTNQQGQYIMPDATGTLSADINDSDRKITLSWNDFPGDTEDGYEVYRSTTSGGQNFSSPLATIGTAATKTYTDTSITPGTVYYYVVRPVKSAIAYATTESYSEIKITAPPANMSLAHRWIVNQEVCTAMGKTPDPANNYRCAFTGQGNSGGFYDMGYDMIVDRFEAGCNFTKSACSGGTLGAGPADCTAADAPGGTITGALGDVYYENDNATCYVNTDGGTTWVTANLAANTAAELGNIISSSAHIPPLVTISQTKSWDACSQMQVNIDDGGTVTPVTKSLMRQKEWRAVSAWSSSLSDAQISAIEADGDADGNGTNDSTTDDGYCNTAFAASNGLRNQTENTGMAYSMFRTGSQATSDMGAGLLKCVSRYGVQDMVGNVWEWTSDQCDFAGTACNAPGTPLDVGNSDIFGWTIPSGFGVLLSSLNFFSPALGIPLNSTEDGAFDSATFGTRYHDDYFYDNFGGSGLRGLIVGGAWSLGGRNGRWRSRWLDSPSDTNAGVGLRCSAPLP